MHKKLNPLLLYAVIGNPIEHSKSPQIHEMFSKQTNIPLKYDKILASDNNFEETVLSFFKNKGSGLNVTVPFKTKAFMLIPEQNISERAKLSKAINTIWMRNNNLYGCNTDGIGLLNDIKRLNFNLHNTNILIIGAGGAARGILQPLIKSRCSKIHIANRTISNAENIINDFSQEFIKENIKFDYCSLSKIDQETTWDLVINTTSSGLSKEKIDLPIINFNKNKSLAYDILYSPSKTSFLLKSESDGATQSSDGLGMLVEQAAESFFIWNGIRPETRDILEVIRNNLYKKNI